MRNQRVKDAMEKYSITQKELAEILNKTPAAVCHALQWSLSRQQQDEIIRAIKAAKGV